MNRKYIAIFAVVALIALAGCGAEVDKGGDEGAGELANETNRNVEQAEVGGSYWFEVRATEANQMQLVRGQPPFQMESSLERQNLIRRYQYLNDQNNVHHVYLMDEGQVISYYVAQGKVSSVNSKLTNDAQIVRIPDCSTYRDANGYGFTDGNCYRTVESPQMDGSYGTNGDAIFFFTTDGDYVESSLDYVVSEEPRNIQDEVILQNENVTNG